VPGAAQAQRWQLSASAGATATYNHYFGADQPSDGFVACLTASLGIRSGTGGRLKLNGTLGASQFLCTGGQSGNNFAPAVNLAANLEVIDNFFFVDATASASTSYVSPFGPQPANLTVETNNRQITQTYSVSPYIQGVIASKISYSLRDDNVWTPSSSFGDSSVKAPTSYYNNLTGQMSSSTGYWGWSLDYSRQYYDNGLTGGPSTLQTAHAIGTYQVDPQLSLSLRGGYERDKFSEAPTEQGVIYGAGMNWRPTERTSVNGFWEHHFFGSSYSAQLSHRLPNVALSANFSRGLSSYPQIAFQIPVGVTVAQFLDAAFTTRIPDPVERALAVAQFLAQSGLPPILISPLNFYTTQISLQQTASVSAVWIGKLNSIGFTVFRSKNEAIAGTEPELPVGFQFATNNTQTGCGVNYSHRLSGFTNLVASATYTRTTPNGSDDAASNARSNNFNSLVGLSTRFSPKTSGSVGLSYFTFDSPGSSSTGTQSTVSVYASITHTF
jgi:uncharacterized protein (PEP-CTERM system associated)